MKTKYLILISILLFETNQIYSQTYVKTPRGTNVAVTTPQDTITIKTYWSNYFKLYYPDATELNAPSSNSSYNCHGYAWNMSEGGITCWMDSPSQYWSVSDQSYEPVWYPDQPSKIYYFDGDHSGIVASDNSIISKWGALPLMNHNREYGPAEYVMEAGHYQYYRLKQPSIEGSQTPLCEGQERIFNSNVKIDGSTYTWTMPTYLLGEVSRNLNTITVEPVSGGARGWLTLQITTPSGEVTETTPSYFFHVGVPYVPSEIYGNNEELCPSQNYWFSVDDPYNSNVNYYWDAIGDAYLTYGQGSSPVEIYTTQPGSFYFTLEAYNTCGYSDDLYSNTYFISSYCKSGMFTLLPKPSTG